MAGIRLAPSCTDEGNAMDLMSAWPEETAAVTWTQGIADAMAWGALASLLLLVPLLVLFSQAIRRRRFWCGRAGREVEVAFEERGLPGLPYAVSVKSCSVFDPSSAVSCGRQCLDAGFRRQWPAALPILGGGGQATGEERP
jgi:hypothetical protein